MNKIKMIVAATACICLNSGLMADQITDQSIGAAAPMDCSTMGMDMQQFASQLNATNKKMFCGQFNDSQRAQAMQMASQQDASGNNMMTSDQAVQKVAGSSNMTPSQKTPTGCPVK